MSDCIPTCFVAIRAITTPEDETILNGFPQLKLELGFRNRNNPPNEAYGGMPALDKPASNQSFGGQVKSPERQTK